MVLKRRDGDLCKAYRPQTFSEVVGQSSIVKSLKNGVRSDNHSQCYLFMGERGCGKTTLARIVGKALNCQHLEESGDPCCECASCIGISTENYIDFKEINASDQNGVNEIRKIAQEMRVRPLFGKVRAYLLDEAHRLTVEAQNALLKNTEDMSEGVYIFLCSTEPKKIIKTLRDRCETYDFKLLKREEIKYLVQTVGVFEGFYPTDTVLNAIIDVSDNRPRNALKTLQKVLNISKEDNLNEREILDLIGATDNEDKNILDLCRLLSSKKYVNWDFIMSTYKKIDIDKEAMRLVIAGWFRSKLERSKNKEDAYKAAQVLAIFIDPLPTVKPENKLVLNIYNAFTILKTGSNDR
jgi:DNA polymerase-3 subunit gamma/tau